jgi:hypothetical protein
MMRAQYQGNYNEVVNQLQYNLAADYGIKFTNKELTALSELSSPTLDKLTYESVLMKSNVKALLLRNLGQGLSKYDIVKSSLDSVFRDSLSIFCYPGAKVKFN